ncbi:MAG TPA: nitronate monooxygenase family protein [Burkholderiales bacterium]|nr:nitronate monooxygenase family protein [Burkholderiales bacterium]
MSAARKLLNDLRLPVVGAPMFLVSGPDLVIAQCKAGVLGSFPALNARPQELLDAWLTQIEEALAAHKRAHPGAIVAPYAVNLIVNPANKRLDTDLETCVRHKVPVIITSLGAPTALAKRVHEYGGVVFHDVIRVRYAEKALEAGVDGLILVCAGAGGHAGRLNPFALTSEVRRFYDGPLVLAGSITDGAGVLAAQAMGCDAAYLGTRFIATRESMAADHYKQMIVDCNAEDVMYTPYFSGVHGSYLKPSIRNAGLDPDNLPAAPPEGLKYRSRDERPKTWKEIFGAGQGVGNIDAVLPAGEVVDRMAREYEAARARICPAR